MPRLLLVDDESKVLEGLENALFDYLDSWEIETATSGQAALAVLEESKFDAIVTDMRMPGMDGADLLVKIKDEHPQLVRMVLSGHSEVEAALRALPVAHQFLSKPCDGKQLIETIQRALDLRDRVSDETLCSLVARLSDLPTRPTTYSKLMALLATDDWSLEEIAEVLSQDVALSLKVLKRANTAFFSRGKTITEVRQAVMRLGVENLSHIVLAAEVFDVGHSKGLLDIEALERKCLAVAQFASSIVSDDLKEYSFLAGLLHEVGTLVLVTKLPDQARRVRKKMEDEKLSVFDAESEVLGVTHAEIGAYLLGLWGMPYPVIEAVCLQRSPNDFASEELDHSGAVYIANSLYEATRCAELPRIDQGYLERLGLRDELELWMKRMEEICGADD